MQVNKKMSCGETGRHKELINTCLYK